MSENEKINRGVSKPIFLVLFIFISFTVFGQRTDTIFCDFNDSFNSSYIDSLLFRGENGNAVLLDIVFDTIVLEVLDLTDVGYRIIL
jgi:hypothetical protein